MKEKTIAFTIIVAILLILLAALFVRKPIPPDDQTETYGFHETMPKPRLATHLSRLPKIGSAVRNPMAPTKPSSICTTATALLQGITPCNTMTSGAPPSSAPQLFNVVIQTLSPQNAAASDRSDCSKSWAHGWKPTTIFPSPAISSTTAGRTLPETVTAPDGQIT